MEMNRKESKFYTSSDFKASFDSGYSCDSRENSTIQSPSLCVTELQNNVSLTSPSSLSSSSILSLSSLSNIVSPFKKLQIKNNSSQQNITNNNLLLLNNKINDKFNISFEKTPIKAPIIIKNSNSSMNENEFLKVLSKIYNLPSDPKLMIGHCMGIDKIDIISELKTRSMRPILDKIFSYLKPVDYVTMSDVSKSWKDIVETNKIINNKRIKCMKRIELSKENLNQFYDTFKIKNTKREKPLTIIDKNCMDFSFNLDAKRHCNRNSTMIQFDNNLEMINVDEIGSNSFEIENVSLDNRQLKVNIKKSTPKNYKICTKVNMKNLKRL